LKAYLKNQFFKEKRQVSKELSRLKGYEKIHYCIAEKEQLEN
jgi:hypothetical protein